MPLWIDRSWICSVHEIKSAASPSIEIRSGTKRHSRSGFDHHHHTHRASQPQKRGDNVRVNHTSVPLFAVAIAQSLNAQSLCCGGSCDPTLVLLFHTGRQLLKLYLNTCLLTCIGQRHLLATCRPLYLRAENGQYPNYPNTHHPQRNQWSCCHAFQSDSVTIDRPPSSVSTDEVPLGVDRCPTPSPSSPTAAAAGCCGCCCCCGCGTGGAGTEPPARPAAATDAPSRSFAPAVFPPRTPRRRRTTRKGIDRSAPKDPRW